MAGRPAVAIGGLSRPLDGWIPPHGVGPYCQLHCAMQKNLNVIETGAGWPYFGPTEAMLGIRFGRLHGPSAATAGLPATSPSSCFSPFLPSSLFLFFGRGRSSGGAGCHPAALASHVGCPPAALASYAGLRLSFPSPLFSFLFFFLPPFLLVF